MGFQGVDAHAVPVDAHLRHPEPSATLTRCWKAIRVYNLQP